MASVRSAFARAVAAHREAVAQVRAAEQELGRRSDDHTYLDTSMVEQVRLAAEITEAAATLTPGWLGTGFDASVLELPLGRDALVAGRSPRLVAVRIGEAQPVPEARFPCVVPLLGAGHLTIDADGRTPAVAGLVRGLLLRLLAGCPAGSLRVLTVDGAAVGATFAPFQALVDARAMPAPATDQDGFKAVLAQAEQHVREVQAAVNAGQDLSRIPYLLLVAGSLPPDGSGELARLAALAHAGPAARLHLIVAGYPPPKGYGEKRPALAHAVAATFDGRTATVTDPPGVPPFSAGGVDAPVTLAEGPPDRVVNAISRKLADQLRAASTMTFADLMPPRRWPASSVTGLRTVVGREGQVPVELAFDDTTPHWLVGGRTGSGKTVFLLDVLYGLAARYSPDELALYLLDFKEGVSFTEFTPTAADPSWIPHARTVGIESDREYGVAVLRELSRELGRRAVAMKRAGVSKLADLRAAADVAMPRILAVIDEYHVLFAGNDRLAAEAAALLEELARKGRSYGVHLILASQTASGVEALYTKSESIFGQFPLRVALAGASGILDQLNTAAEGLPIGTAVINDAGGIAGRNRLVRFPDAHADAGRLAWLRHQLWEARTPGSPPPAIFAGYAEQRVEDDPGYRRLKPGGRRRLALVGRNVDVGSSTAAFALDASPGRHVAVLGPSPVGADIVHAAAVGLGRQHEAGTARFVLAPLVAAADPFADDAERAIKALGHPVEQVDAAGFRAALAAASMETGPLTGYQYLVVFGCDAASAAFLDTDPLSQRDGRDDLRKVLRDGPAKGIHLLGWWRGVQRFGDDLGVGSSREDVACLVALNVPATEIGSLLGQFALEYTPRPNRALLADRHEDRTALIVPFTRPELHEEGAG